MISRTAVLVCLAGALNLVACQNADDPALLWLLGAASAPGQTDYTLQVDDVQGNPDFVFQTTQTVAVHVTVLDPFAPVSGTLVQLLDQTGSGGRVLFRASTDASGNIQGNFTVDATTSIVRLLVTYNGTDYHFDIDITGLTRIDRTLFMTLQATPVTVSDQDGDGIPDELDSYPEDPTRATMVRFPATGHYTIAFEDLFPRQGDADFNDFVVRVVHEEDLNAAGSVVALRGEYTHLAKGAGYNHTLHLNLTGDVGGEVTIRRYDSDGVLISATTTSYAQLNGLALMPRSDTTIGASNTRAGSTLQIGDRFEFEIIPAAPISRAALGGMPYDLYLYVLNTRQEIHFAGRYKNEAGQDIYLDQNGFPWALMVPGDWQWMLERKNIHDAYQHFEGWYTSSGANFINWYETANPEQVFVY